MKAGTLVELADKWEREADADVRRPVSSDDKEGNALARGRQTGLRECADALRALVELLG